MKLLVHYIYTSRFGGGKDEHTRGQLVDHHSDSFTVDDYLDLRRDLTDQNEADWLNILNITKFPII